MKVLREMEEDIVPRKDTKEKGLALFIDGKMTKAQFELIAHSAAEKNSPIYPLCNNFLEAKKFKKFRENFTIIGSDSTPTYIILRIITKHSKIDELFVSQL